MKNLNYFYDIAKKENIPVYKEYLGQLNGLCIGNKSNCKIYINNKIKDETKEKIILGHELGHYFKGIIANNIFSTAYQERLKRAINEFRAEKWLISEIIPFDTLVMLLKQNMSEYDISEKLDVPVQLIRQACYLYEEKLLNVI